MSMTLTLLDHHFTSPQSGHFSQQGFQTVAHSGDLTPGQVRQVEQLCLYSYPQTGLGRPPVVYQWAKVDDYVALGRIEPRSTPDAIGRTQNYYAHHVLIPDEELSRLEYDLFTLLSDGEAFFGAEPQSYHRLQLLGRREYRYAGVTPPQVARQAQAGPLGRLIESLLAVVPGPPLYLIVGDAEESVRLLTLAWEALPVRVRSRCCFRTFIGQPAGFDGRWNVICVPLDAERRLPFTSIVLKLAELGAPISIAYAAKAAALLVAGDYAEVRMQRLMLDTIDEDLSPTLVDSALDLLETLGKLQHGYEPAAFLLACELLYAATDLWRTSPWFRRNVLDLLSLLERVVAPEPPIAQLLAIAPLLVGDGDALKRLKLLLARMIADSLTDDGTGFSKIARSVRAALLREPQQSLWVGIARITLQSLAPISPTHLSDQGYEQALRAALDLARTAPQLLRDELQKLASNLAAPVPAVTAQLLQLLDAELRREPTLRAHTWDMILQNYTAPERQAPGLYLLNYLATGGGREQPDPELFEPIVKYVGQIARLNERSGELERLIVRVQDPELCARLCALALPAGGTHPEHPLVLRFDACCRTYPSNRLTDLLDFLHGLDLGALYVRAFSLLMIRALKVSPGLLNLRSTRQPEQQLMQRLVDHIVVRRQFRCDGQFAQLLHDALREPLDDAGLRRLHKLVSDTRGRRELNSYSAELTFVAALLSDLIERTNGIEQNWRAAEGYTSKLNEVRSHAYLRLIAMAYHHPRLADYPHDYVSLSYLVIPQIACDEIDAALLQFVREQAHKLRPDQVAQILCVLANDHPSFTPLATKLLRCLRDHEHGFDFLALGDAFAMEWRHLPNLADLLFVLEEARDLDSRREYI